VAWFEGPHFRAAATSAESVHSEEAWVACAACFALVQADDREALVERRVAGVRRRPRGTERLTDQALKRIERDHLDELFWAPRSTHP
jgi:hypothetical protein